MKHYSSIILLTAGLFSNFCTADVLIIERIQNEQSVDMPSRGSSMQQVIQKFGEPVSKKAAIGNPPITEWQYTKYSVYFEKKWVIDSVLYKASPNEKGPKYISN